MTDIIVQLAELIVKDNAILFVGADLGSSQDSSPLVNQIADALALRINYAKPDRSLAAIARDFQAMQGRNALILALREELAKSQGQPSPIHQLIADAVLPSTKVITRLSGWSMSPWILISVSLDSSKNETSVSRTIST